MKKEKYFKEYTVSILYSSSITVKVIADSDEEAVSLAIDEATKIPMNEADTVYDDYQIESIVPIAHSDLEGI